ncbi:hypothetical protein BDV33DRAFT_211208 [Aspergillus novoparasiticus]|uniref:Uncharacterized protein n=1 Tax=Aspergillus novoparasiticus TaxID=986946 RepID=A0A5N6E5T5_9EURO|nr:hypothetical protein BDV33DRAFT_211208 [Aspergillus novoparasiticus]
MYIESFGESGSIFDTLHATRAVFSKLPNGEVWLRDYIYTKLRYAVESNENTFQQNEFYQALGGDYIFTEMVLRMVVCIYSRKARSNADDRYYIVGTQGGTSSNDGELDGTVKSSIYPEDASLEGQEEQTKNIIGHRADERPDDLISVVTTQQAQGAGGERLNTSVP